jgi:hypothetical protein
MVAIEFRGIEWRGAGVLLEVQLGGRVVKSSFILRFRSASPRGLARNAGPFKLRPPPSSLQLQEEAISTSDSTGKTITMQPSIALRMFQPTKRMMAVPVCWPNPSIELETDDVCFCRRRSRVVRDKIPFEKAEACTGESLVVQLASGAG